MKCPNCGEEGPHFVPPSLGEQGFYTCSGATEPEPERRDYYLALGFDDYTWCRMAIAHYSELHDADVEQLLDVLEYTVSKWNASTFALDFTEEESFGPLDGMLAHKASRDMIPSWVHDLDGGDGFPQWFPFIISPKPVLNLRVTHMSLMRGGSPVKTWRLCG